jgi:hypothetical protein
MKKIIIASAIFVAITVAIVLIVKKRGQKVIAKKVVAKAANSAYIAKIDETQKVEKMKYQWGAKAFDYKAGEELGTYEGDALYMGGDQVLFKKDGVLHITAKTTVNIV